MSRASELTIAIILIQAAIGFVDASGMFQAHYLDVPQNNASYTLTDLNSYASEVDHGTSLVDQAELYAYWAWDAFFIGLKIIFAVVFVLPTLINTFGVPVILATFIQAGIYYMSYFSPFINSLLRIINTTILIIIAWINIFP